MSSQRPPAASTILGAESSVNVERPRQNVAGIGMYAETTPLHYVSHEGARRRFRVPKEPTQRVGSVVAAAVLQQQTADSEMGSARDAAALSHHLRPDDIVVSLQNGGWPPARRHAGGQDGHRGAVPQAQHQQEARAQQDLSVPAARPQDSAC